MFKSFFSIVSNGDYQSRASNRLSGFFSNLIHRWDAVPNSSSRSGLREERGPSPRPQDSSSLPGSRSASPLARPVTPPHLDTFCLDRRSFSISLQHTSLQRLFPGATLSTSLPCSRTRHSSSDITISHDVDTSSSIAVSYSDARAYGSSTRVDLCYALHPWWSPLLVLNVHLYLKF